MVRVQAGATDPSIIADHNRLATDPVATTRPDLRISFRSLRSRRKERLAPRALDAGDGLHAEVTQARLHLPVERGVIGVCEDLTSRADDADAFRPSADFNVQLPVGQFDAFKGGVVCRIKLRCA